MGKTQSHPLRAFTPSENWPMSMQKLLASPYGERREADLIKPFRSQESTGKMLLNCELTHQFILSPPVQG
jgi:hypothetical protein